MKIRSILSLILVLIFTFDSPSDAQSKVRVRFARGATSSTITGTVRGYAYKDYVVGASAGQTIDVRLNAKTKCVFTVFKPDGDNLDIGADSDQFTSELPVNGDYVVRVLLMRNEARRETSSSYKLSISIK